MTRLGVVKAAKTTAADRRLARLPAIVRRTSSAKRRAMRARTTHLFGCASNDQAPAKGWSRSPCAAATVRSMQASAPPRSRGCPLRCTRTLASRLPAAFAVDGPSAQRTERSAWRRWKCPFVASRCPKAATWLRRAVRPATPRSVLARTAGASRSSADRLLCRAVPAPRTWTRCRRRHGALARPAGAPLLRSVPLLAELPLLFRVQLHPAR